MKKTAIAIFMLLALVAYAAFPVHTNRGQSDMNAIAGNWDSFRWVWTSGQTESNVLTITQGTTGFDMTGTTGIGLTMIHTNTITGYIVTYATTNVVISTTNLIWVNESTNLFVPDVYLTEVYAWNGATSNSVRVLGQGQIRIVKGTR